MTPKEEKWLAEYNRREARQRIKGLYRALALWGAFAIIWLTVLFSMPKSKFDITDSLFLMTIIVSVANIIRELIRNKRIAADRDAEEPASGDSAAE